MAEEALKVFQGPENQNHNENYGPLVDHGRINVVSLIMLRTDTVAFPCSLRDAYAVLVNWSSQRLHLGCVQLHSSYIQYKETALNG